METPTIYGMVHFSPLEGDPMFHSKDLVLERAKKDLDALLTGGVNGVIFENNFDNPKFEALPPQQAAHFEELTKTLVSDLSVPWGVSALWNDYALGFRLCAELGGSLVRVPVFVDSVETAYGTFIADPDRVKKIQNTVGATGVSLIADVQVKHARMLEPRPLNESVQAAANHGADGAIITGSWTGDPPTVDMVKEAREADDRVHLFIGSGVTADNIQSFVPYIDGCIVGSAFKEEADRKTDGPNIVDETVRYDVERIKTFMLAAVGRC